MPIAQQVINWVLAILSVVLSPPQAGQRKALAVDVIGPAGFVRSLRLEEGELGSVTVRREGPGEEPAPLGEMAPRQGAIVCTSADGEFRLEDGEIRGAGPTLRAVRDGGEPLQVEVAGQTIVIARRGANLYLTDAGTGETYVVRAAR